MSGTHVDKFFFSRFFFGLSHYMKYSRKNERGPLGPRLNYVTEAGGCSQEIHTHTHTFTHAHTYQRKQDTLVHARERVRAKEGKRGEEEIARARQR